MKIQLTSFENALTNNVRLNLTAEIINKSEADLLLFCGHTIGFVNDIEDLKYLITNKKIEAILELEDINTDKIRNCLYRVTNGKLISMHTNQILTQSSDIDGNYQLGDRLIHEFENKRFCNIKDTQVLVIQCGEINILKNIQSEGNRVEFRLSEDKSLNTRFNNLLSKTKIILNPIHTPMGNQGKMHKRRQFLSKNKKYYFSTSNMKINQSLNPLKSVQYAYYNGDKLTEIDKLINKNSISRIYKLFV